jgi:thiamine-phosphate pyrophosphorylase
VNASRSAGSRFSLKGFYAILDVRLGEPPSLVALADRAEALLRARPACLQLRAKGAAARDLAAWSRALLPLAHASGVPFCVNDRLDVALAVGADAVHLGQDDLPLAEAKAVAGDRLAIGISTHNEAQLRAAAAGGADYLGLGPIFATQSKANPDPVVGIAELARLVPLASVPVVAIGGIDLANVKAVAATGVAAAAVISAVERASDPTGAAEIVAAAFA